MFNVKNLLWWGFALLLCSGFYGFAKVQLNEGKQKKYDKSFVNFLQREQEKRNKQVSYAEGQEGAKKLAELKEMHSEPKELFEKIRENYKFESYLRITDELITSSGGEFSEWEMGEKNTCQFEDRKVASFSLSEHSYSKAFLRWNIRLTQKNFLPIKGAWGDLIFLRKVSTDPEQSLPIRPLPMRVDEKINGFGSSSKADGVFITEQIFHVNHANLSPGLYALQYHLFPDRLMAETADGIIKSDIFYLRLRK